MCEHAAILLCVRAISTVGTSTAQTVRHQKDHFHIRRISFIGPHFLCQSTRTDFPAQRILLISHHAIASARWQIISSTNAQVFSFTTLLEYDKLISRWRELFPQKSGKINETVPDNANFGGVVNLPSLPCLPCSRRGCMKDGRPGRIKKFIFLFIGFPYSLIQNQSGDIAVLNPATLLQHRLRAGCEWMLIIKPAVYQSSFWPARIRDDRPVSFRYAAFCRQGIWPAGADIDFIGADKT